MFDGKERRRVKRKVPGAKSDFSNKKDAEEKPREHLRSVLPSNGATKPNAHIKTFQDAAKLYLELKKAQWEAYGSYGTMCSIFGTDVYPVIGKRPLDQIVKSELQLMFNNSRTEDGTVSESLLKKVRTHVGAVFAMAVDDKLITGNPVQRLKLPKHCKLPDATFLTMDQIHALLAAAEITGTRRDRVFLKLFVVHGVRPGECLALRLDDVGPDQLRLDEMLVRVRNPRKKNITVNVVGRTLGPLKTTIKTVESKAPLPLRAVLRDEILEYARREGITNPREFLFQTIVGTPLDRDNYLDRVLKPLAKKAGIEKIDFRKLRRSCATNFLADVNKGQVKETQSLMRAHGPRTTLKYYSKPLDPSATDALEKWHEAVTTPKSTGQVQ